MRRDPDEGEEFLEDKPLKLNPGQASAMEHVLEQIKSPDKPMLMHGVTGSGKTEVYLQAAQRCLDMGKSVLVLLARDITHPSDRAALQIPLCLHPGSGRRAALTPLPRRAF